MTSICRKEYAELAMLYQGSGKGFYPQPVFCVAWETEMNGMKHFGHGESVTLAEAVKVLGSGALFPSHFETSRWIQLHPDTHVAPVPVLLGTRESAREATD